MRNAENKGSAENKVDHWNNIVCDYCPLMKKLFNIKNKNLN